ncbi:HD family phosphohydrolase [Candidatus Magnetomoraceae bacterium gMMP-15]
MKQTEIVNKLLSILIMLSYEKDLKKLLNVLTYEAKELLFCDKATIYLVDKQKCTLSFFITEEKELRQVELELSFKSIAGFVALSGKVLNIEDVYIIPSNMPYRFNKEIDKKTGYETHSMLVAPLNNHEGEIIGVFQLINKKKNNKIISFPSSDESTLLALSSSAGISIENAILYQERESFFSATVKALATAIDARDPTTSGHSRRVANYTMSCAKAMKIFNESELKEIYVASLMHDVGKIGVREHILNKEKKLFPWQLEVIKRRLLNFETTYANTMLSDLNKKFENQVEDYVTINKKDLEKIVLIHDTIKQYIDFIEKINFPGCLDDEDLEKLKEIKNYSFKDSNDEVHSLLTNEEFENLSIKQGNLTDNERCDIESHVLHTYDILQGIPFPQDLKNVPEYAVLHHEKLDGSGYPFKLENNQIPMQARIMALCDIYDALTARDRPYKKALSKEISLKIIKDMVDDGKLDKKVFDVFVNEKIYLLEANMADQFRFNRVKLGINC